ncbi:hypothetical protein JTE90_026684 [Oedothorax gibbosus]|uniref:Uncharacterized protein n=1 Tax=Oedothorax gibbosus TaxID=931172 RepID=A0AAV6V0W7_9ARAC|nr:hypothetical protein JTE90_026684 [Oedothorax gibbosus]
MIQLLFTNNPTLHVSTGVLCRARVFHRDVKLKWPKRVKNGPWAVVYIRTDMTACEEDFKGKVGSMLLFWSAGMIE